MTDLHKKISHAEKVIRESTEALATATPHSNKEKDAKRRLEKYRRQLVSLQKELRYVR